MALGLGAAALAAGIAATASTVNAAYNNAQADLKSDTAYRRQQDLMRQDLAQRKDLYDYQFAKESAYNSPSAEMKRYEQANLNPYLLSQHSDLIGNGNTSLGMPSPTGAPSVQKAEIVPLDLTSSVAGLSQALVAGSQIRHNQAESFSKIVDALPKLGESLGFENMRSAARDMLGIYGIQNSQYERRLEALISGMESEARSKAVKAQLDEAFGKRDADQRWALGEQAISESFARIGKMSSDRAVNDATIKKLASDIVRNVADAWKLRKEGEKFAADAKTVNALRSFVVSQARSYANMLNLNSYLSGAEEGTDLFDFKHSGSYAKNKVEAERIRMVRQSDAVWTAVDRFFDDYIKIMGSPSAGGSSSETMYTSPQPKINGF